MRINWKCRKLDECDFIAELRWACLFLLCSIVFCFPCLFLTIIKLTSYGRTTLHPIGHGLPTIYAALTCNWCIHPRKRISAGILFAWPAHEGAPATKSGLPLVKRLHELVQDVPVATFLALHFPNWFLFPHLCWHRSWCVVRCCFCRRLHGLRRCKCDLKDRCRFGGRRRRVRIQGRLLRG